MNENLILNYMDVVLRDLEEEDIKDYIDWYTIKTEWQDWEAPWDGDMNKDIENLEKDLKELLENPLPILRKGFEIDYKGNHVGWTNSYPLDGEEDKLAIGIVITESKYWERHIGEESLICFIRYILDRDPYRDIFIETWEKNKRMINLAKKLGFEVSPLEQDIKVIDGKEYVVERFKLTDENVSRYRI